jgi:glycosyltransferase 2 family protein
LAIPRRSLLRAAQWAFAAVVVWYLGATLAREWSDLRSGAGAIELRWPLIAGSAAVVLVTYALLVQTWRAMLGEWGAGLGFWQAARIWSISNFGRYVPGKVWGIATMSLMAQRRGVSPVAAAGSSVIVNLVSTVTGFLVVFATGAQVFRLAGGGRRTGFLAAALLAAALLSLPYLLPLLGRLGARLTGRQISVPAVPARAIWLAAAGTAVAWVLYGVAFQLFCGGVLGRATGAASAYIAVYTGSYLLGFLALFAPGGLGVRELAMQATLVELGLANSAQAVVVAIASRLWLTVLEIVPGLLFLARDGARRRSPMTSEDASS